MFHVYILTDALRTTLYINSTDNLGDAIARHKNGAGALITRKHKLNHLIYLESFENGECALSRHKILKNWRNEWKWNLILAANPKLRELICVETRPIIDRIKSNKKSISNEKLLLI